MPPKTKKKEDEALCRRRLAQKMSKRRRYNEIKNDPELLEIQRKKRRERYLKQKEKKKELSSREQREQRKKWRENSQRHDLTIFLLVKTVTCEARNPPRDASTTTVPPTLAVQATPPTDPPLPAAACPDDALTASPLQRLRAAMQSKPYLQMNAVFDAFLVFYSDEHLSEEPAPEERRLQYISGWDGAGAAAVLASGPAAVWVPSGEVRRARASLSCAWTVFDGDYSTQSIAAWISSQLGRPKGRVGADARLASISEWKELAGSMQNEGLQLVHVPTLLDQLWNEEPDPALRRPDFSRIVANLHPAEYAGQGWRDKVAAVRAELRQIGADAMVVTALDEVAWLLNVRGRDVPYAPLLKAFVVVTTRELRVYAPQGKLSMPVREALAVYNCYAGAQNCTKVNEYASIYTDLRSALEFRILIPTSGTFQRGASAAIAQSVPQSKRLETWSPIIDLKAQKNDAEVKGMRMAHLRDAVAMSTLLSYMEGMMKQGMNEVTVAQKVDETRATQANYQGSSMQTRVAFGASAADPDYRQTMLSNRQVFKNSTLVIQSGGQYVEGTTSVTRTLHYGRPTAEEKRAYTYALQALAALATLQAPESLPAAQTDPTARAPLWARGQDYPHPTGHGVGAALNRREDPVVIDYRQDQNLHQLKGGYFITSEPAWYEAEKFGVRLGNVLEVVGKQGGFLRFSEVTLVPFEPKLIEKTILTEYEINWLNAYNQRIRTIVGPELKTQGLRDVYYWMMNKTVPFELPSKRVCKKPTNSSRSAKATVLVLLGLMAVNVLIL